VIDPEDEEPQPDEKEFDQKLLSPERIVFKVAEDASK
jgi:hypothetical protein